MLSFHGQRGSSLMNTILTLTSRHLNCWVGGFVSFLTELNSTERKLSKWHGGIAAPSSLLLGAAGTGSLTHAPAWRQRLFVVLQADRRVHAAQEELEIGRALDLHQRPELMDFQSRFVLRVVVELVGHVGVIVADTFT